MGTISNQAEQAREGARQENGQFGSWASGESGASLVSQDVGEQAYDVLTEDEQAGWNAWREMTGKSEETVAGQAKADDIADFKRHYLGSSEVGAPNPESAERAGFDPVADPLPEIFTEWDEMVSSGKIEDHIDEETGDHHFFAHPTLLRELESSEDDDEEEDDSAWEHIKPDFDDYTIRSQDAVRMSGLDNLQSGEIYWDHEKAFASAQPEGRSGSVGFEAHGEFADVETDYLSDELAERVQKHSGGRELNIAIYSNHSRDGGLGENSQYVSVDLNEAERNAVVDYLDEQDGEEMNSEIVEFWERGGPKGMDDTFGFVSPKKEWEAVSDAVRERAPEAAHALETAEDLRRKANASFEAEVEHMNSDDWKKEEAERRQGF